MKFFKFLTCFLIVFLCSGCTSSISINADRYIAAGSYIERNNPEGVYGYQFQRIMESTYTIFKFTFYAKINDPDHYTGFVAPGFGRGVLVKRGNEYILISDEHVFGSEEVDGYIETDTKYFIVRDWDDMQKIMISFGEYLSRNSFMGHITRDSYDDLFKEAAVFNKFIGFNSDNFKLCAEVDSGYAKIDLNGREDEFPWITMDYFDLSGDLKIGETVGIWGNPYGMYESYREGVIANITGPSIGTKTLVDKDFAIISIICSPGDSGSPVIKKMKNGEYKIIGLVSTAFTKQPSMGGFCRINVFFKKLGLIE